MELAARTASKASGSRSQSSKDWLITCTEAKGWQCILAIAQKFGLGSRHTMGKPSCAKATVAVPGPQPISRLLEEEECFAALTAIPTSWPTRIQILGELIGWENIVILTPYRSTANIGWSMYLGHQDEYEPRYSGRA